MGSDEVADEQYGAVVENVRKPWVWEPSALSVSIIGTAEGEALIATSLWATTTLANMGQACL